MLLTVQMLWLIVGAVSLLWLITLWAYMSKRSAQGYLQQQQQQQSSMLQTRIDQQQQQLNEQQQQLQSNTTQLQELIAEKAVLHTQLTLKNRELQAQQHEKTALLEQTKQQLAAEFERLAQTIFDKKSAVFTQQNKNEIGHLLAPLKQQLQSFHQRIDDVHVADSKDRAGLRAQILELQQVSAKVNKEAADLTRALKGNKKLQGNWGEVVLERLLEDSGLRKGHEYESQASYQNSEGLQLRPDVVLHLPEGKDLVIDAKVSLLAYEQATASEDEQQRLLALNEHITAIKRHISELSQKHYSALTGLKTLDFVLMFLPIEPAFNAAMEHRPQLFNEAYEKGIILVSPTTLLVTLRTIHNIWRVERQNKNAKEIAQRAASIYNKLHGFVDDMEKLGRNLNTANTSYELAMKKLSQGQGNLIKQAKDFVDLGVKVKKTLPQALSDQAEAELDTDLS